MCELGQNHLAAESAESFLTYRYFEVDEREDEVFQLTPLAEPSLPYWARDVQSKPFVWSAIAAEAAYFADPIPFVHPPTDPGEPFYPHNHQPDITWLPNGDLMAVWYSTKRERGTELIVLASRLRVGARAWDPSAVFFKAEARNMHGNSLFYDETTGWLHHFNGMGKAEAEGFANLALLHRYSLDGGVSWSVARPVSSGAKFKRRHQVIAGMVRLDDGTLIQPCDATPSSEGSTAIHVSRDGGLTWADAGGDIRGIHAGLAPLPEGHLLAFGRAQALDGRMPQSISVDLGRSWDSSATEFPPIGSAQRLVLMRLREGPLLLISFTYPGPRSRGREAMTFIDAQGVPFEGIGMFSALSYDDGKTWKHRKLLTPGGGTYPGYGWTGSFTASPVEAEDLGYLAATQSPDNVIHLISSGLHYRFNLKWLQTPSPGLPR